MISSKWRPPHCGQLYVGGAVVELSVGAKEAPVSQANRNICYHNDREGRAPLETGVTCEFVRKVSEKTAPFWGDFPDRGRFFPLGHLADSWAPSD
jgi:hypothetical protein